MATMMQQLAMPTQMPTFGTHRSGYSKRTPNCQKCSQHGRKIRLKGHKRACPYRNCECPRCEVVSERQKLMAAQIKQRRRQRKASMMSLSSQSSGDESQGLDLSGGTVGGGTAPAANLSLLYGLLAQQSLTNAANAALTTAVNTATLPTVTDAALPTPPSSGFPLLIDPAILAPQPPPAPAEDAAVAALQQLAAEPVLQVPEAPPQQLEQQAPIKTDLSAPAAAPNPFATASTEDLLALLTLLQQQRLINGTAAPQPLAAPLAETLKPSPLLNCAAMAALSAGFKPPQAGVGPIESLNVASPHFARTNSFVDILTM